MDAAFTMLKWFALVGVVAGVVALLFAAGIYICLWTVIGFEDDDEDQ